MHIFFLGGGDTLLFAWIDSWKSLEVTQQMFFFLMRKILWKEWEEEEKKGEERYILNIHDKSLMVLHAWYTSVHLTFKVWETYQANLWPSNILHLTYASHINGAAMFMADLHGTKAYLHLHVLHATAWVKKIFPQLYWKFRIRWISNYMANSL